MSSSYWWNKRGVKKKDLANMPNGWLKIKAAEESVKYNLLSDLSNQELRNALQEIQAILQDLEAAMRRHGIGFAPSPNSSDPS